MQCTAKSKRSGKQCKKDAVTGRSVCHIHGGHSPSGIAAANLRHGRYSKQLPTRLIERYEEALHDDDLLSLRDEVALLDARLAELVERLGAGDFGGLWLKLQEHYGSFMATMHSNDPKAGAKALQAMGEIIGAGADDVSLWTEIKDLTDQRRRLVEAERKRLVEMQQMITHDQAMLLVGALVGIIRARVHDRSILSAIQADITGLLARNTGVRAGAE